MIARPIEIKTPDGVCDGYAVYPSEDGRYPAVVFYMDAIGVRPALVDLAKLVAEKGYYVLLPNLFYRAGKAPVLDYAKMLRGEDADAIRAKMMELLGTLTPERVASDTTAFIQYLDAQPQVRPGKLAVTGYCMGGGMALRAAANHPDRVAAAASYHGGRLATDDPSSPHRLVGKITGEVYLGHARNDHSCPQDQIDRLEAALNEAGVKHQTEIYDAAHGWTMPDLPHAKNEAAAKKAWDRLFELLDRTLKQPAAAHA